MRNEWFFCEEEMPPQTEEGTGRKSEMVDVILSDGSSSEDWLINDRWVIHCKTNGGAYPVKWRKK